LEACLSYKNIYYVYNKIIIYNNIELIKIIQNNLMPLSSKYIDHASIIVYVSIMVYILNSYIYINEFILIKK